MEKSLLSLINMMDPNEYQIDLLLLEECGGFMDEIPEWVNVTVCKEYTAICEEVNSPPIKIIKNHIMEGRIARAAKLFWAYVVTKIAGDYYFYYKAVFKDIPHLKKKYDVAIAYTSIINYLTWFVDYCVDAETYIGWIHFDISKLKLDRKMTMRLHRKMKKIYVVSQAALNSFVKQFPELKEKCELRYNVIDEKKILMMAEEPVENICKPGTKTIVTIGRLTSEKGQDIIPEIAAKLKNQKINFRWYLIGDGNLRSVIEQRVQELNVENEVVLLGTKKNPYPYLKQADLYVQTSIHEGFCITLGEAKVFGMPIISTEFAGAHEQLDGVEKCSVVQRNVNILYNQILKEINKR